MTIKMASEKYKRTDSDFDKQSSVLPPNLMFVLAEQAVFAVGKKFCNGMA
jgi:hypothetical protein